MLKEVTKVWRKTNFRNLTSLKKLPRIEGSDHEGSLYHPAAKIDIGIQVDFASDLQAPEAQDNSEISAISAVSELDRHVQVEAQLNQGFRHCGPSDFVTQAFQNWFM